MLRRIILALLTLLPFASPMSLADMTPTQQDFIKLYLASFLRAPDLGGLNYWSNQVATGALQQTVGGTIFGLPIVTDIYPSNLYDQEFVESIYRNVFGRDSDTEGLNYWATKIATLRSGFAAEGSGNAAYMARGQLVMDMINAGLGTVDGTDGKAYIVNRLDVAKSATQQQLSRDLEIPPEKLLAIESCANADPSSVTKALQEITNFYNPAHTLGGTVSGLASGQSLTLLYGCGNVQKVTGNGSFTFAQGLAEGANYAVTISVQPSGQTCTVGNGSGAVASSNVTNVAVTCAAPTQTPTPIDPELVNAVTNAPPSTQAEIDNFVAKNSTPEAIARTTRLRHNQDLILSAVDPEPQWFSTHASADMILGTPGSGYSVDLRKRDINKADLGAVDKSKLRLELRIQRGDTTFDYIPAEYQADYVQWDASVAGRLNIKVPADLNRGRLIIGVRPNFKDAGQAAIAERWSVAILVDVWPLKPNVTTLNVEDVYYPLSMDASTQPRQGGVFTQAQITDALAQKGTALQDELVKPLVVKGQNLMEGQLVSYMIPLPTGGSYPYGGRVRKVINGSDGQQLVLLDMVVNDVYDIVLGNGNDKQFVQEGIMPEFITYRIGEAMQGDAAATEPALDHFGPDDRVTIQGGVLDALFSNTCQKGNITFSVTPYLTSDDVGVDFTAGATNAEIECTLASTDKEVDVPFFGAASGVLKFLIGAGVSVKPDGALKLKASIDVGTLTSKIYGGASYKKGGYSGAIFKGAGTGSGLDGTAALAKAGLTGEAGAKGTLQVAGKKSLLGTFFGDIGIESKVLLYTDVAVEGSNPAGAKMGKESKAGLKAGIKVSAKTTSDLEKFLKEAGFKVEFLKVETQINILNASAKADYQLGNLADDGKGKASAEIKPSGDLFNLLGLGSSGAGYASLDGSSVYNDKNMTISYDVQECAVSGKISTPFVGCVGDFLCAKVKENADLCGGVVSITPVTATANTGENATTQGMVSVTGVDTGNVDPLNVSVSGSPLNVGGLGWSASLLPGESKSVTVSSFCGEEGVTRGEIVADAGSGGKSVQENVKICKCKPGDKDCDKLWGDPYLLTADGLAYDYVASGDYILQQVYDSNGQPKHGMQVQARFLPGFDVSWPYASAMQVGDDVVEFTPAILGHDSYSMGMEIRVNGQYIYEPAVSGAGGSWPETSRRTVELPGGGMLYIDAFTEQYATYKPRVVTVLWPANSEFSSYALRVSVPDGQSTNLQPFMDLQFTRPNVHAGFSERGMMGNNDGDPSNDFMRRNGDVLGGANAAMSWTAIYGLFGGDWLVKPYECLFSDGCATQPDFPTTAAILTPEQRAMGEVACSALSGFYKEACIHDVGLSGSVDLVRAYYANTEDLNAMADELLTPGVDLAVYALSKGQRENLPENTQQLPVYRQGASVAHVSGDGKFLLTMRPPRNASARFAIAQPGAGQANYTGTGDLATAVDVNCGVPDTQWAELFKDHENDWATFGAVQLWALDPLSGFAKVLLGEFALYCGGAVTGKFNDTGIVTQSYLSSTSAAAQQDAVNGRDYAAQQGTLTKVGASTPNNDKANGFDFTKIGSNGQPLAIQKGYWDAGGSEVAGTKWDCVLDNVTGLLWENKSDDNGLRDKDWTYTWYNSNSATNGGNAGTASGGSCILSGRCDTEKFVADVNAAGLCGYNGWRMPTLNELQGITDLGRVSVNAVIDTGYFPTTLGIYYWSASPYAANPGYAWFVHFLYGYDGGGVSRSNKAIKYPVRLVRGQ